MEDNGIGTQLTCFTGTKVQILTLRAAGDQGADVLALSLALRCSAGLPRLKRLSLAHNAVLAQKYEY